MQTAQDQISGILQTPSFILPLALALGIAGAIFLLLVSAAVCVGRLRPAWGAALEKLGMTTLLGCWVVGLILGGWVYYSVEVSGSRAAASKIIQMAALPADKRMIFVDEAGWVTISERASAINERGELVVFRRGNVSVPVAKFPEVWKIAGGTAQISPSALTVPLETVTPN